MNNNLNFEIKLDSLKYLKVVNGVWSIFSSYSGELIRELDVYETALVQAAYKAGYNQRSLE